MNHRDRRVLVGFSGGFGAGPHSGANLNGWTRPEADVFADRARAAGVSEDAILVENAATNTGENCRFSAALLDRAGRAEDPSLACCACSCTHVFILQ